MCRRAWGCVAKLLVEACVKPSLVQILVVVANILLETLKAEVEQGSMRTAVGHGLFDPERQGCSAHAGVASFLNR